MSAASNDRPFDVVTGAFSYTGKYIARRLLASGRGVRTLTGHPRSDDPLTSLVEVRPYSFDDEATLVAGLEGADTLYNTYWVRFPHRRLTFDVAAENSFRLIEAAKKGGVRRIVHVSITGASPASELPYFRGKGQVEEAITRSGLSYAILRPTVVFGGEDILINNIAWFLRRFPVFAVFGSGQYPVQPVHVGDLAEAAVRAAGRTEDLTLDAVGPEIFAFEGLVRLIARAIGRRTLIVRLPPRLAFAFVKVLGLLTRDVVLTWDEVRGLMAGLLASEEPPLGSKRLNDWLRENAATVGRRYASELARHYR